MIGFAKKEDLANWEEKHGGAVPVLIVGEDIKYGARNCRSQREVILREGSYVVTGTSAYKGNYTYIVEKITKKGLDPNALYLNEWQISDPRICLTFEKTLTD